MTTKAHHIRRRGVGGTAKRPRPGKPKQPTRRAKAHDRLSSALASGALAKLVSYFVVRPEDTPHTRALMRHTGLSARSFQIEFARLEQLGLLCRDVAADGRVHIRATENQDAWKLFRALVRAYADSSDLLRLALVDVPGVAVAFIFGSVARGTADELSDLDLCVIVDDAHGESTDAIERMLAQRTVEASMAIGREVNTVVLTASRLIEKLADERVFYLNVLTGAKRWVLGSSADAARLLPATAALLVQST